MWGKMIIRPLTSLEERDILETIGSTIDGYTKRLLTTNQELKILEVKTSEDDKSRIMLLNRDRIQVETRVSAFEKQLTATIKSMKDKDYGICHDCGENIHYKRLLATPMTVLCISCKEWAEKDFGVTARVL